MRMALIGSMIVCVLQTAWAVADSTSFYRGTIGRDNQVTLRLTRSADGKFEGVYRYDKVGQDIYLEGSTDAKGQVGLNESVRDGEQTGRLVGQLDPKLPALTGRWVSADGKRNLDVALKRIARTKATDDTEANLCAVTVAYVVFDGEGPFIQALNAKLRGDARQMLKAETKRFSTMKREAMKEAPADSFRTLPYTLDVSVDVVHFDRDLVSLLYTDYAFTGGAHGNDQHRAQTLHWDGKALRELKPGDMVSSGDWGALGRLCADDLRRQGAPDYESAKFSHAHPPVMNVAAAGLVITFAPYEVGPYVAGSWTVVLPYASVRRYLKPGIPILRLAN